MQHKNKELQFKLDEKQVEKEFSGYRTEDYNFSNYEEEFDLKKMVNGAREKIDPKILILTILVFNLLKINIKN